MPEPAARLLAACEALVEELGGCAAWVVETNAETASSLRAQLGEADFAEAYRRGEQSTTEEAVELALGVPGTSFAADR